MVEAEQLTADGSGVVTDGVRLRGLPPNLDGQPSPLKLSRVHCVRP
jgi:hypothetical protein